MTITASQQTSLERPVVQVVYFAEFQFLTATGRYCTANQTITWGGYDWIGLGAISSIGTLEESDGLESSALNFTLSAAQSSWLALAVGSVEEYRGRAAKLYFCPLNEQFQLVDTPVICWRGSMDMISVGIDGEEGTISLKCETSAFGLKRRPSLRVNAAQQRAKYPNDSGLDFLTDLLARPSTWLSKRFQAR